MTMGSVGADKQLSFIGFNQIESASGLQCCNLQIRNMKMQKSQIQSRKDIVIICVDALENFSTAGGKRPRPASFQHQSENGRSSKERRRRGN